jgi:hypothetical protein
MQSLQALRHRDALLSSPTVVALVVLSGDAESDVATFWCYIMPIQPC